MLLRPRSAGTGIAAEALDSKYVLSSDLRGKALDPASSSDPLSWLVGHHIAVSVSDETWSAVVREVFSVEYRACGCGLRLAAAHGDGASLPRC